MGSYFVIGPWDGKGEDGNAALTRLYGAAPAMVAERKAGASPPTPQRLRDSHVEPGEPPNTDHLASLRRDIPY
jgi:hypothetical protein